MNEVQIPPQLQKLEFRFVLLGTWNKWKNLDTKQVKVFEPNEYENIDKKVWKPLGKMPFEKNWQSKNYTFNNSKVLNHKGNIGIIGGFGDLRILDIDEVGLATIMLEKTNTFSVRTGSGGVHLYFISDYKKNHVLSREKGELRSYNYQVVTPNCRHPSGNLYKVIKDIPIQHISSEDLFELIKPYIRQEGNISGLKKEKTEKKEGKDDSRSGFEFRKVLSLLRKGKSRQEIYDEMNLYSKWSSSPEQYRTLTFEKAENFFLEEEEQRRKKEEEKEKLLIDKAIQVFIDKRDLAKKFLKIQPLYYDKNKVWWIWNKNESRWVLSDEIDILNGIAYSSLANTINSKEKNEILEALKQEARLNKPKEIKETWVQFKDIIIDIETGEEFKATPEFFVANPIPWKIGESEDTPKIDKLFESWVKKEDIQRLFEVFGFVIVPRYFIHSFFFLYSPPGHGKTTFEKLLIKFVGDYNYTSTSIDRINKNIRFETKNWYRKLLITLDEVNNVYQLKNSSVINGATGESPVPAEFKGSNQDFKFINYAKFIYPTNKLLKVDPDDGFGRRVRKIDFVTRFEKEKDVIAEIPNWEFENLAKKSLRIAKELWKKRQFTGDLSISERMKRYQEASKTTLENFIDEECDITDSESYIPFDDFYANFCLYLRKNTKDIPTKIKVSKELRNLGWEMKIKNYKDKQVNLPAEEHIWNQKMSILGIKFKEVEKIY